MMLVQGVIFALGLTAVLGIDPCDPATYKTNDEPHRSVDYVVKDTDYDAFLCDMYTPPGWYRFSNSGTIPTHAIDTFHCGTKVPLWINGQNPTVQDGIVDRTVCGKTINGGSCGYTETIQVLNCGNFYVYNLKPTSGCHVAYCAGTGDPCPDGQISANGFQPGCADAYPKINTPHLSNPIIRPRTFEFGCSVPFDAHRTDVEFEVEWLFDGQPDPNIPHTHLSGNQREAFLDQKYLANNLNKNLSCAVSSHFTQTPFLPSPYIPSNSYYVGIKVSNGTLFVGENEKPKTVQLISTIPFVCNSSSQASCNMEVYLDPNNHDLMTTQKCTQTFHNSDWDPVKNQAVINFQVLAERDFLKDGDKLLALHFRPITSVDVPSVFLNYQIPYMTVQTKDKPTSTCTCTGDPHCTTLDQKQTDKKRFDYFKIGDFTMYKSTSRNFEVQVRTWECTTKGKIYTCACGVAVREGNDIMMLDMCNGHYGHTFPELHVQHQGALSQGTTIQRDDAGNNWVIYLPSGAWVKVHNHHGKELDIEIQAPADDFGKTEGLCGFFDGNKNNDLLHKDGTTSSQKSLPDAFTESWRIPVGNSFFDKEVPIDPALNNDIYYCNCDSKNGLVDCRIDNKARRPGMQARCAGCHTVSLQHGTTQAGRRRRHDVTIPVFVTPNYFYRHDYGLSFSPNLNVSFPTTSGTTFAQAEKTCKDAFQRNAAIRSCIAKAGLNFDEQIKMCVEDIKLSDTDDFVQTAVLQGVADCLEWVLKEPSFYDNTTNLPPAFLTSDICPNGCSGRGDCVQGTCHCDSGYVGSGCDIDSTKPPSLVGTGSTYHNMAFPPSSVGLCDVSMGSCDVITVVGNNIYKNRNLQCRVSEMKYDGTSFVPTGKVDIVPIEYQTMYHALCRMPTRAATAGVIAYNISISNDGQTFSNAVHSARADPKCMRCNPRTGGCRLMPSHCLIEGKCYTDGQVDTVKPNRVCNVSRATVFWTVKGTENLPVAPLGGKEFSRYDIWTTLNVDENDDADDNENNADDIIDDHKREDDFASAADNDTVNSDLVPVARALRARAALTARAVTMAGANVQGIININVRCADRSQKTVARPSHCLIEGKCYTDGQVDTVKPNRVCNVSRATVFWTVKGTENLPVAPLGGKEFSRYDIWTTSRTGCPCVTSTSRTDCACCDDGGCQCPGDNQHQCAMCGQESENCGTPATAPDFGIDGYTLALNDCECDHDHTRYTCACCQNNGCQCGERQTNQCAECGRLIEQCGAKPWIFGPPAK